MNVPTFDSNILIWNIFWQQFDVSIHSKAQLKDAEKLTYLRDAPKTVQRGMSLKVCHKMQTTIKRPLVAFKDAMIDCV